MARPRKTDTPDLTKAVELTAGAIERLRCPPDKTQAFLRDAKSPGLRVRVTAAGAKSFVFEAKLNRKTIRRTIGDVRAWSVDEARAESNRLRVTLDCGTDPRELEREREAARVAAVADEVANALTVGEVWKRYIEERRSYWSENTYRDHLTLSQIGGEPRKRRPGVKTVPGPLASLLPLRLMDIDAVAVESLLAKEAKLRPTRTRLAVRCFKAFLRWAASEPDLKGKVDATAASSKKLREKLGKAKPKRDYLEREQLATWFEYVRQIPNPIISAYLQCLLLTGARREEMAALRWDEVNFRWRGITIRDKMEDDRAIPLTPYVAHLLGRLPRRNEFVFSSTVSASGQLREPSIAHRQACSAAGLELTLHGLRRSFKSLSEWLEVPVGVVAQIMGHKPSATAEKHYTVRPLDLLRVHHEKIEAWISKQAGIEFDADAEIGRLRLI